MLQKKVLNTSIVNPFYTFIEKKAYSFHLDSDLVGQSTLGAIYLHIYKCEWSINSLTI